MPPPRFVVRTVMASHEFWYRVSGGALGGKIGGVPCLLLTTTGRKSGRKRTTPLLYLRDGQDVVIVASYGGSPKHPTWYGNLVANPEAEVLIGREQKRVVARTANDDERARLWPRLVEMYKSYAEYQTKTERTIPVVILAPKQ
ncbi:MAG: nitroreductase family deazaflavin-dependent oxidoreductase [Dehalococcoidia bacterium]